MTPLEKAEATIAGLEAVISHKNRAECKTSAANYRAIARGHDARAHTEDVKERLYELENQHQPLARLVGLDILSAEYTLQRDAFMRALRYVVFGIKP